VGSPSRVGKAKAPLELLVVGNLFPQFLYFTLLSRNLNSALIPNRDAGNDDNLQRSADNLAILAAAGRPYGLTMNLEPMPWTQLRTIADAQAMIAASGREDIGILVDALHFWRAGESLAALSSLPAHRLNYMQLCDGAAQRPESEQELIRQARSARNVPGEGGLDLHGLMSALPATLPVSLEVPLDGEQGALPPLQRAQLLFNAAQPYLRSCA